MFLLGGVHIYGVFTIIVVVVVIIITIIITIIIIMKAEILERSKILNLSYDIFTISLGSGQKTWMWILMHLLLQTIPCPL